MSAVELPTPIVGSPCTNVCRIDTASGWCEGCRRHLDEIAAWSRMSDAQKLAVWALLPLREPPAPASTGTAAAVDPARPTT